MPSLLLKDAPRNVWARVNGLWYYLFQDHRDKGVLVACCDRNGTSLWMGPNEPVEQVLPGNAIPD